MKKTILALGLISICVAARMLPHPTNFAPIAAAALFAGVFIRSFWLALALPLGALLVGDSLIGFYDGKTMAAVYFGLSVPPLLIARVFMKTKPGVLGIALGSLSSSVAFFLISNGAVWAFSSLYVHNPAGIGQCFAAALPFFRNTAVGDLFWSAAFFGTHAAAALGARHLKTAKSRQVQAALPVCA